MRFHEPSGQLLLEYLEQVSDGMQIALADYKSGQGSRANLGDEHGHDECTSYCGASYNEWCAPAYLHLAVYLVST